jgi:hypothetical protein
MANVTIDIAGMSVAFTLADADANRILAAHTAMFTRGEFDENGQPIQVVPSPPEVVQHIAQQVVNGLAATTVLYEQDAAAVAAREAVPPIEASIAAL